MKDMMRSIGLMSGTSMDGIDAAIIETDGDQVKRLKLSVFHPYDKEFKSLVKAAKYCFDKCGGSLKQARSQFSIKAYFKKLKMLDTTIETELPTLENYISDKMAFCAGPTTLDRIIQYSTHLHGLAVLALLEQSGFKQCDIDVVGFHGQTMYHNPPEKISVIVGDGQALADQTGILVVNNFRARDVAAGGQGAPFAPLYHEALVKATNMTLPVIVINCGGIGNVTVVCEQSADLVGFDTGPGNALLDQIVTRYTQNNQEKETYDKDGKYALAGRINEEAMQVLYKQTICIGEKNYFDIIPPKALDTNNLKLPEEFFRLTKEDLNDMCATLAAFTADTIVSSVAKLGVAQIPKTWILAGGGSKHPVIKEQIATRAKKMFNANDIEVKLADDVGFSCDAMEAEIFAYLAVRSLQNKVLSVPGTTGVPKALTGGHAYKPTTGKLTSVASQLLEKNPEVLHGYEQPVQQQECVYANGI